MKSNQVEQLVIDAFANVDVKIGGKRPGDITINNDKFYGKVIAGGSLALGETYMDGWWECDDLGEFMRKILKGGLKSPKIDWQAVKIYTQSVLGNLQTLQRSKKIADVHYNLPSEMYMLFLGPFNQYSSYYYAHAKSDEEAEKARLDLVCRKLKLSKDDKVLDIGCGWGGFAKYAAEKYGCHVTGISIAEEQIAFAKNTVKDLPVEFRVEDYRNIAGKYTKIFSGGMLEHVGYKNYPTYFKQISNLLKNDGIAVIDSIGGSRTTKGPDPWLGKYVFPNSMVPSATQLSSAFEEILTLEDWHNFGIDYGKTLSFWTRNFKKNWSQIVELNPNVFTERFYRMWLYYLGIFEGGFYSRYIHQWQLVFTKPEYSGVYRSER